MAIGIKAVRDLFKIVDNRKISATKFIDGGAPIFLASKMNTHMDIVGAKYIIPLEIRILRLFVDSYMELAREKRPEEARPCATIIIRAPRNLQEEGKNSPTISKAI